MKNIHVLPTDKPSRLHYYNHIIPLGLSKEYLKWKQGRNIYITSNEEIKDGDWFLTDDKRVEKDATDWRAREWHRKIILTTDQDLIKDGVQAIDDDFLEWFVKNPSFKEVEVILDRMAPIYYEIIIPKGEPKQCDICKMYPRLEGTNKCESCYSVIRHFLEQAPELKEHLLPELRKKQETPSVGVGNQIFKIVLDEKCRPNKVSIIEADNNSVLKKQETLEEAAQKFYPPTTTDFICSPKLVRDGFIAGAKWQAERMYSEEEVGELLYNVIGEYGKHYGIMIDGKMLNDLFEQFKKK